MSNAERLVQKREREFRSLVENSTDFIARFDRQFRYLYVNPALCALTGIPLEEFIGKTYRELETPEAQVGPWDQEIQQVFETGESSTVEYTYAADNGLHCFQSQLTPELGEDGRVETVLSVVRDISDIKKTEQNLRTSEERYRAVVEQSITGIYIFRADHYIYVNKRFAEIFGYSEEEILSSLQPTDVVYEADRAVAQRNVDRRLSGDTESVHYTVRGVRKDGTIIWIEIHGSRIELGGENAIAGMVLDITERVRAQEAQRQSDERLGIVISNLPVVVFELKSGRRFPDDPGARPGSYRLERQGIWWARLSLLPSANLWKIWTSNSRAPWPG